MILTAKTMPLLLFYVVMTSCDQTPLEPAKCGGVVISTAPSFPSQLEIILSCDGWLSFVIDNVSEIEFVDVSSFPSSSGETILGQAFCAECKIRIAVLRLNLPGAMIRRSDLEIARLIVHEAAHLADNCENGEEPALAAERAFRECIQ